MQNNVLFISVLIFLFSAVITVPVARRLGMGAVQGYLIAGIMIGPWGLGFIRDVEEILHFSELGVVFLMFIIGLELNPAKLWKLRRPIFGMGTAQIFLTSAVLGSLLYFISPFFHFSWQAALIGGIGLAMSSTAMALQLMKEKGMNHNEGGKLGFSVLLFQDMTLIPAVSLIPVLVNGANPMDSWGKLGLKIVAFVAMLICGRYLLRPLFRYIAACGVREIFTASALLVVLGSALFMATLGFSMALGTFIAGGLLAESEFRHELEIAIEPFKGLLLGLLFISVGMALNLGVLFAYFIPLMISVILLVSIKAVILYGLSCFFHLQQSSRLQFAVVLSQGGEFAFVLFSVAFGQKLFTADQLAPFLVVVTLSMMTTPFIMELVSQILKRRYNAKKESSDEKPFVKNDNPQVIIVGFGRFGQVVGRLLMANKMHITVLERDVSTVSTMRKYGYQVYYGDATRLELLRSAGADKAEAIVITCNEPEDTMILVHLCQQHFPKLRILARARGRVEAHELLQNGVKHFTRETFSGALDLGRKTLLELGMHPHEAYRAQQHFRRLDMRTLREFMPEHEGDVSKISRIKEARCELEEIFEREMQDEKRQLEGWYEEKQEPSQNEKNP